MSSPIARTARSKTSALLIDGHQKLSHSRRTEILAQLLGATISDLAESQRCLDIGCGDMTIAEMIAKVVPISRWQCLDLYPLPVELTGHERWQKYLQFDGLKLPFADQSIDVALFCDVLHHMSKEVQERMLTEAARVAKHVVIKDHFEYGFWSRNWLRAMDFMGNWAYGVSVPKRYFNRTEFLMMNAQAGLKTSSIQIGIDLYRHIPIARYLLRKEWQFIAVMSRKD